VGKRMRYDALYVRPLTLTIDKSTIEKRFGAKFYIAQASYDYEATYNAAPSQMRTASH